eukprot:387323_1
MLSYIAVITYILLKLFVNASNVPVGIVRWDAWNQVNGYYDEVSYYVQNDMSPQEWHYRLPFFTSISPNVSFNNNNQTIIDQEILYASKAGINYWAFDTYCKYGPNCQTSSPYCAQYANQSQCCRYCPEDPAYGLNKYLSSQYKHLINFTIILLGSIPCDPLNIDYYISLMKEPTFQTVTVNGIIRPLIYLFVFRENEATFCGGWDKAKQAFDNIRAAAINNGLNNPYFVFMEQTQIDQAYNYSSLLGFDAISCYSIGSGGCSVNGTVFAESISRNEQWWSYAYNVSQTNQYKVRNAIPCVQSGVDTRPRYDNPPPWTHQGNKYYFQPTVSELQKVVSDGIDFVCRNKEFVEAQTIMLYAWNECTENGACIIPTLGNGTAWVDALSDVLPRSC